MRGLLIALLAFIAVTAIPSGLMLISKPDGSLLQLVPSLLSESPFRSFLIPGIALAFFVGGTNAIAMILCIKNKPARYLWAIAGGVMMSIFILVQVFLIPFYHWLQAIYLGAGVFIVLISLQLRGKWAA